MEMTKHFGLTILQSGPTMRHPHSIAVFFMAILLMATSVSTLNYENLELEVDLYREKLTNYLSSVLCSIDLKYANIYLELEPAGKFLDGIIGESSRCVATTLTIITYKNEGDNVLTNTSDGARLIILIAKKFDFKKSMFPKLLRIRKEFNFELFYMIVSEVRMSADHESLLKQMYKNYNLLNAVVVAVESGSSDPTVITYNPFNDTTMRIPNNAYKRSELFIKKNSNIFGSPINIVTYKDLVSKLTRLEGSEMINFNYDKLLPDLIAYAMNATLMLRDPSFSQEHQIGDVGSVDLTINGRSYESSVIMGTGIERTNIMRRDDICLLLPYMRIRNTFKIIYRMVDPLVWMLMVVVMLQAWISLLVIKWAQRSKRRRPVFLFDLFGFHMNQGLPYMPIEVPPRLIIVTCLMYCLVIKSIFEGLLYTSMAKNKDSRISTIAELLESHELDILISNGFYNISKHSISKSPIKNHFKVVDFPKFMQLLDSYQHSAYVVRRRVAKYLENTKLVNGIPAYYTMDECIVPFVVSYFVRQGSPYLDQINRVLRISEESGLFNYWEEQLSNAYKTLKQNQRLFVHRSAINFKQLVFVFQTLCFGLAISTTVFVFELFASRLKAGTRNWLVARRFHRIRTK